MKQLTLREAAAAVGGSLSGSGSFQGVYTDSRKPLPGGLFVALEGERFDGHAFLKNAEADGAAAVMCRKPVEGSLPVILVENTGEALLSLAAYYRSLFSIPVVGLTGSVGKTTTKEMTALVLSEAYRTVKTQGNLNNEIGVPMTLFTLEETTQAAVIEMGMNHRGEISRLTSAVKPDAAIITNIGVSHIENLGSRDNILAAKLEILEGMRPGSPFILNGDNDLLSGVRRSDFNCLFFGMENKACAVRAAQVALSAQGTQCSILYGEKRYPAFIPVPGLHNVYDALAAFTAGVALGIDPEKAAASLSRYVPAGMRQKTVVKKGVLFIEDCYNASPDSVKAGINTLVSFPNARKIAVLGDMLELGAYAEAAHSECGAYAAQQGIDCLFTYGSDSRYTAQEARMGGVAEVYSFEEEDALTQKLLETLRDGDAVLFKASRGMKLENTLHKIYKSFDV